MRAACELCVREYCVSELCVKMLCEISSMLKKVLLFTLTGAVFFTIGILIGHFGIDQKKSTPLPEWVQKVSQDVDENLIENFLAQVDTRYIEENLQ